MNKKTSMEEEKEEFAEKHSNSSSHLYLEAKNNNNNIISKQKSSTIQFYIIIIAIFFIIYYLFFSSKGSQKTNQTNIKYNVLVGDIGGTHIRFRLLKMSKNAEDSIDTIDTTKLKTADFPSMESAFVHYLKSAEKNYPQIAIIGVPGPVQDNTIIKLSNIPHWKSESGDELSKKLNIKKFLFLNDFACNSYGIQTKLKLGEDYIIINKGEKKENGPMGVIGPGTGLGMGYLLKDKKNKYYTIGNSEGGHQNFSRKNKIFFELAEFVKNEYNLEHVTIENICSGQGMVPLYKFLLKKEQEQGININDIDREKILAEKVDKFNDYKDKKTRDILSNEITQKGVKNECHLSRKVIELFIQVLADTASDLALLTLPTGGIYLLGGISVAIEPFMKQSDVFMKYFIDKDHSFMLQNFPVYLIKNDNIGMLGAAEAARRLLEED